MVLKASTIIVAQTLSRGDRAISPTNPGEIGRWFDSAPSFCGVQAGASDAEVFEKHCGPS
jgi:hypothetical protein